MTCAKRHVSCVIVTRCGKVFHGDNSVQNPQTSCPRAEGEGYDKCLSVCKQTGHAEQIAVRLARQAVPDLFGAVAFVFGHYRICDMCATLLKNEGIQLAFVRDKENEHPKLLVL